VRIAALGAALRHSGRVAQAVAAAALVAGLLMVATEPLTVASVELNQLEESCKSRLASEATGDRCTLSGFERHGGALILLGGFTIAMGFGAGPGRSRPAAYALVGVGAIVLAFGLLVDLPETGRTGAIGRNFEGAEASPGAGLFTELLGGALALGAGLLRLTNRD
jgi:hypothetical protein